MKSSFDNSVTPAPLSVSVVIPAYNAAAYLAEAIKSVKKQTVAVSEIIVVNDGSTDDTEKIAERMGATVISQNNKGLAAARNIGIRNSKSDWVALLDADDVWTPTKIERQWQGIGLCQTAAIVTSDHSDHNEAGEIIRTSYLFDNDSEYPQINKYAPSLNISIIDLIDDSFWRVGNFLSPSTIIFKKELGIAVGLFNEDLKYVEDVEFFLRLLTKGSLVVVEETLMQYRIHTSNWSRNELGMSLSFLKIVDMLRATPEKYPKGAYEAWVKDVPDKLRLAGTLSLKNGKSSQSREFFRQFLDIKFDSSIVVLFLASYMPMFLVQIIYRIKQRFV